MPRRRIDTDQIFGAQKAWTCLSETAIFLSFMEILCVKYSIKERKREKKIGRKYTAQFVACRRRGGKRKRKRGGGTKRIIINSCPRERRIGIIPDGIKVENDASSKRRQEKKRRRGERQQVDRRRHTRDCTHNIRRTSMNMTTTMMTLVAMMVTLCAMMPNAAVAQYQVRRRITILNENEFFSPSS